MNRAALAILPFVIALNSLSGDFSKEAISDAIITLDVGGKVFRTSRSTLCKFPETPLARMFAENFPMRPSSVTDGYPFLDDDPIAFDNILDFLRSNTLTLKDLHDAERTRKTADKLCSPMVPLIDEWMTAQTAPKKKKKQSPQDISLTVVKKLNGKGSPNWFVCNLATGETIGSTNIGGMTKEVMQMYIEEHQQRNVHKDLCISWSGCGNSPYKCRNGQKIGDRVHKGSNHEFLGNIEKFLDLQLIENIVTGKKNRRYVCTFNDVGTFSIFSVKTGKKKLPDKYFATHGDCVVALRNAVKAKEL